MNAPRPEAVATEQINNDVVVVTEWSFEPRAETGWHRHEYDYVVVPRISGHLLLEEPGRTRVVELTAGCAYFREAGVEHNVVSCNDYEFMFVEIEIK